MAFALRRGWPVDHRPGKAPGKAGSSRPRARPGRLIEPATAGFTGQHVPAFGRGPKFARGANWTKIFRPSKGLLEKARKRGARPRKRPRLPPPGLTPHRNRMRHTWPGGQPALDLITPRALLIISRPSIHRSRDRPAVMACQDRGPADALLSHRAEPQGCNTQVCR
jgi:hypothetical protein